MTAIFFPLSEQIAWQRRAVTVLAELLSHPDLPVLSWTVGNAGVSLLGRSIAYPSTTRRREVQAWADRLGIPLREHKSSGMTRLIGHAKQMGVGKNWATITITADIYDDDEQDEAKVR